MYRELDFEVVVIGAGPGGYTCAIKLAQLGLKVAIIEKNKIGGTCLNVGCIPSKTLLHSSQEYYDLKNNKIAQLGILVKDVGLNMQRMMESKDKIVHQLGIGIQSLLQKHKIQCFDDHAFFLDQHTIHLQKQNLQIRAKYFVIATGSEAKTSPNIIVDEQSILTSTGALELREVPESLLVMGGGYIGLEIGSIWSRLGSNVCIVEYSNKIAGQIDSEVSVALQDMMRGQGITFYLNTEVLEVHDNNNNNNLLRVHLSNRDTKESIEIDTSKVLLAIGRTPCTRGLMLEKALVHINEQGFVKVDDAFRTSAEHIYAIGDVIGGAMLAHKASQEAVAVAEIIAGKRGNVNYKTMPSVLYTKPEVASVGPTQAQLDAANIPYKMCKSYFAHNGMAHAALEKEGFVKILYSATTHQIISAYIVGSQASNLLGQITSVMEFGGRIEDLARSFYAHPGFSETIKDAANQ
ncbi:Dihydrolipoyl dehydrogenase [Rickettsiales endosymbiont of Paramecium tredecaurelia]|uniref:dihydrolipoyl dehydrogenase n=1 Tax=Candidatus Sarmatiella mevalonica TaxID=2770581 RepID=UPI001920D9F1|nr:dihydrolipoyl dehydrogenase [Candidatus Sarmatiella mevalonica]MBL3284841.1 Dihydrolipoyl dehydrogenase [Candidatus Sarmatiella mevalonica]